MNNIRVKFHIAAHGHNYIMVETWCQFTQQTLRIKRNGDQVAVPTLVGIATMTNCIVRNIGGLAKICAYHQHKSGNTILLIEWRYFMQFQVR